MDNTKIQHPVLGISIGGTAVEKRPSSFTLVTDSGCAWSVAHLRFAADAEVGKLGDAITVTLSLSGDEHLLFTGEINNVLIHGAHRDVSITDSYSKLLGACVTPAYRKETAKAILQDALDSAGITKTAITCPEVEIGRFSIGEIPASMCISLLIRALEEHGHEGYRFFFDTEDTFHFGTIQDTGKNDGKVYAFETGKNILEKHEGMIEVLPLPIRHAQEVTVDGVKLITSRTDLTVSGQWSRLALWLEEAP